jgi:hypothetical protein
VQVEDPGDIPSCGLGHEMVRNFTLCRDHGHEGTVFRCHTTLNRRPLIAVADAEGSVNLFEWDLEQVSYRLPLLTISVRPDSHSPINVTQKHLRNVSTLRVAPSHALCLSLDWSNKRAPTRYI